MNTIYFLKTNQNLGLEAKNNMHLLGELIVRTFACERLKVPASDLILAKGPLGKPYLKNYPDFYFNISHSKGGVAVVFSDSPVGIDIELLREPDLKVADRYFCENERNYINSRPDNQSARFFEIWTKKEAYVKQSGEGISAIFFALDVTDKSLSRKLFSFQESGFFISLCANNPEEYELVKITEQELQLKTGKIPTDNS